MSTLIPNTDTSAGELHVRASDAGLPVTPVERPIAVQIVVPVYNEQRVLRASVRRLHDYLIQQFNFAFEITIADNASIDATPSLAWALAHDIPEVRVLRLERKGRGRALRAAWSHSEADVVAYMDVDLSTDLGALPELLIPLLEGHADVAIGSRLAAGAQVTRGIKRELISRSYNLLLRALLGVGFSDAQCGFKAVRREAVQALLAEIEDDGWFFDTELLYRAEQGGLAIREVPVRWVDDPDSRVAILATARADLEGVRRLRAGRVTRETDMRGAPRPGRYARPRNDYDRAFPPLSARPVAGLGGLLGLAGAQEHDRPGAARG
jgi:glycosyltransferase involved in cell wall biosynthesis